MALPQRTVSVPQKTALRVITMILIPELLDIKAFRDCMYTLTLKFIFSLFYPTFCCVHRSGSYRIV